ncbi:AlpA family transcriptional regulator [Halopseudomonas aestusnigri]|uniref:AlpA family transcriptional regulator n=1 Tax=Halopseudomonas aestusnigri TaxID=857252 RepID=UPI0025534742|nr:AlpA family transcriptional regulator [Halopseudomonas aestusnigri]MDL2198155.1 AlpA family transcriptional regulator [Halopseudomonas aestusnigri]
MRLIRLKDVMQQTGLARATIYKYMNEGCFPLSVTLGGRSVAWVEKEVNDWILARVKARDAEVL